MELRTVLSRALEVARATVGRFDPTVGPFVALWRQTRRAGGFPPADANERALREARERAESEPDPSLVLLPIVPWFPRSMARILIGQMFSYDDALPVSCSNLGEIPSDIANLDGTPADFFFARSFDQAVTLRDLKRSVGTFVVVSGRLNGRIWLAVEAYQLGADNTRERLHELMDKTLAEFGLDGVVF